VPRCRRACTLGPGRDGQFEDPENEEREDADLRIIEVPLRVHCHACQQIKAPRALYNFRCPDCGHPTPKVVTGREMELVSIELSNINDARGVNSALPAAEEISARGIMGMAE
jgi:predicted RNA-binding Zn-ribbon protein involved in translation (DUF1610 family)